jgi:hypothetical protein
VCKEQGVSYSKPIPRRHKTQVSPRRNTSLPQPGGEPPHLIRASERAIPTASLAWSDAQCTGKHDVDEERACNGVRTSEPQRPREPPRSWQPIRVTYSFTPLNRQTLTFLLSFFHDCKGHPVHHDEGLDIHSRGTRAVRTLKRSFPSIIN